MNLLQVVILLNNEGARLLTTGRTSTSMRAFSRAGKLLRQVSWNTMGPFSQDKSIAAELFRRHQENDHCDEVSLPASIHYVCRRPLVFPLRTNIVTQEDLQSVVDNLSLYIVFNLALACHHYGRITGTDAPLQRAMDLYQAVLRAPVLTADYCLNGSLVQCIVLNNISHLHSEKCNYMESQCCLRQMRELICCTGCLHTDSTTHNYLTPAEANEIVLNSLFHKPPPAAHAA